MPSPNAQYLRVRFNSGSVEPSVDDSIVGDTSEAVAVLVHVELISGTWLGGDAAGYMFLNQWDGAPWTPNENWTANPITPANHGTFVGSPVIAGAAGTAYVALSDSGFVKPSVP